jgi:hypothetical protein
MVGGAHSQYQLGDGFSLSRYNPDQDTNRAENVSVCLGQWAEGTLILFCGALCRHCQQLVKMLFALNCQHTQSTPKYFNGVNMKN